jgi:hypothetical protein
LLDSEDILKSITDYLTEIVGSKSRINNAIDAVNAIKEDSLLPNVSNDIVLGQRINEINTFTNGRINIDIVGESKFNPAYDTVIKHYIVELSYIVRDDFAKNVFLRTLRMERVFTDVMQNYFKDCQEAGFIKGEIESSFTPERVLLGNTDFKAIKSGIVYKIIIF